MTGSPQDGSPQDGSPQDGSLLAGALGWLEANLDWFRPPYWARHLHVREFDTQPALELLLLARSLGPDHPLTGRALDVAATIVAEPAFAARLLARDPLFRYHLFLLALLHAGGRAQPALLASVQDLLDADPDPGPLDPVEHVELRYVLDLAGLRSAEPPLEQLAATALAGLDRDDPGGGDDLSDNDVYGLTHVVLYAADLGRAPLPAGGAVAARLVEALLPVQIARGDHDLTAELLLTGQIAGVPAERLGDGWRALAAARHDDGAVPSPPWDPTLEAQLEGGRREGFRFATRYHTTLVTALAAVDRLRHSGR